MAQQQKELRKQAQDLLLKFNLRKTGCRIDVLELFLQNHFALSHSDLEKLLGDDYDRVTLYRTLHSFKEQGLVHSINDVSGSVKYALCREVCSNHQHHDNHLHFNCTRCGQTFCLDEVVIPATVLPEGYQIDSLHFSAQGICKSCNATPLAGF
ncbi:Fur family transcriptional regulator [Pontibacter locisalis]|uniref:Fur family transcriptional regulator n=1 Tax=Pontibacter locisalis TaxID=1719035 RepID=A0ABW5IIR0_9BACT